MPLNRSSDTIPPTHRSRALHLVSSHATEGVVRRVLAVIRLTGERGNVMKMSGGIIALIAGIFGIFAAGATLLLGGIGSAVEADGANTVVGLGWGGVFFSFVVIVLGAVAIGVKSKVPGVLLIISSLAGAILGGTLVALFMFLSLIGGILVVIGAKRLPLTLPPATISIE